MLWHTRSMSGHSPNKPLDSGSSGEQELEPRGDVTISKPERLDSLYSDEPKGVLAGLAQIDPDYMGGRPGQALILGWLHEQSAERQMLRSENARLTELYTDERIRAEKLQSALDQANSEKRLRQLVITIGGIMLGGSLNYLGQTPVLGGIVAFSGLALVLGGWALIPVSRTPGSG